MATVASYSFKEVTVLISGVPAEDFAPGDDAIQVARSEDGYNLVVGADGASMVTFNPNKSAIATLRLLQSSRTNAALTAKLKIQDAGELSPFPFAIRDANGLDLVLAEAAFVVSPPEMRWGAGHNAREWRLALPSAEMFALGVA